MYLKLLFAKIARFSGKMKCEVEKLRASALPPLSGNRENYFHLLSARWGKGALRAIAGHRGTFATSNEESGGFMLSG